MSGEGTTTTELLLAETRARLFAAFPDFRPPRILLLYGSLRERAFSRLLTNAAADILRALSAEVEVFDPHGLPMPDSTEATHPKVAELRRLSIWSEGQVWCSPERHGAITSVMKAHFDWIPVQIGDIWPTQGRTVAVMQVNGGVHSFNAVNALRLLARSLRMIAVPNQLSISGVSREFDETDALISPVFRARLVDLMEELMKFTLLTREHGPFLLDRYSEREALAR